GICKGCAVRRRLNAPGFRGTDYQFRVWGGSEIGRANVEREPLVMREPSRGICRKPRSWRVDHDSFAEARRDAIAGRRALPFFVATSAEGRDARLNLGNDVVDAGLSEVICKSSTEARDDFVLFGRGAWLCALL